MYISDIKNKIDLNDQFYSFDLDEDWKNKDIKILKDSDLKSLDIRYRTKRKKYP